LYRLSYFVFCSLIIFCVFLYTRANFVIGICAVKFARKLTRIELIYYWKTKELDYFMLTWYK
jgi:hypothetical protein